MHLLMGSSGHWLTSETTQKPLSVSVTKLINPNPDQLYPSGGMWESIEHTSQKSMKLGNKTS